MTPDDHYYPNTTCHHCHNLQHYLLNITKYFTSNTQLLFLPGLHHLHTDLIIQNAHNISLIGSTANGTTLDTVIIQCNSSVGIVMTNITNLTMMNMVITGCKKLEKHTVNKVAVTIENCFDVILSWVHIYMENKDILHSYSLWAVNVLGKSKFSNFSCNKIILYYHDVQARNINNTLLIDHFQQVEHINTFLIIDFMIFQHSYQITTQLAHMMLQHQPKEFLHGTVSNNILYITDCQFLANQFPLFDIKVAINNDRSSITFINCKFFNNSNLTPLIKTDVNITIANCIFNGSSLIIQQLPKHDSYESVTTTLIIKNTQFINCKYSKLNSLIVTRHVNIIIVNCMFNGNSNVLQLSGHGSYKKITAVIENTHFNNNYLNNLNQDSLIDIWFADIIIVNCSFNTNLDTLLFGYAKFNYKVTVIIKNTQFVNSVFKYNNNLIMVSNSDLLLEGIVTFHAITNHDSIIALNDNSTITIHGAVMFSNNIGCQLITFKSKINQYIKLKEPSNISIYHNQVCNSFVAFPCEGNLYQFCIFQYYTNETYEQKMFSIEYFNNQYKSNVSGCNCYNCLLPIVNCHWLPESAFHHMIPTDVNNQFIKYINNSDAIKVNIDQDTFCACNNQKNHDCSINDLGYLYPGETLNIFLYCKDNRSNHHSTEIIARNDINILDSRPCIISSFVEQSQNIRNNYCSKVSYSTLTFWFGDWCELFLKVASSSDDYNKRFYVRKLSCPPGFIEINRTCQCDPIIVDYGITKCNINNQTVLRPRNTWITATNYFIPYSYYISQQCRFYYCLPQSSHLNFSTPNSQCQYNRSGLLCGHCQQGLSTVFSTSHCRRCSNVYLFLIIPIIIVGFMLVVLLFFLNTTVTDGTINGFILFANIISINTSLVFSRLDDFTPAYTFISLANLDLGIQTCFYNGMDDYAKMWLQLAFPFYLIFIAMLIIITSRYSTRVQRLIARRALPVLATLFLLSYTKILRIVSSVLFFYSTITHLPSKHTTLVWSVDANVPLFGVRFTILFIACLILFLILVPFNVILLFTRTLSRFRFINRFKPLLDAYQGPYKISYYNYTGVQLLIRAIFFALSSLERNINLVLSAILLSIIIGMHGVVSPFKNKVKNSQEMLYLINLQILFVVALYDHQATSPIVFNILLGIAAFHFVLIIMYHIFTYSCNDTIKAKICSGITTTACRIFSTSHNNQRLVDDTWECNTRNEIPEAVNYHQYRETLLNEHY